MLQSSISESFNYFEYTIYYIKRETAEGSLNIVLQLKKDVIKINKKTGKITSKHNVSPIEVKSGKNVLNPKR